MYLSYKTPVNLNLIYLQPFQITQRRISCSKVINRNLHSFFFPIVEHTVEIIIVLQLHTLRNFQSNRISRKLCLFCCINHILDNRFIFQLNIGNIYTDIKIAIFLTPECALCKRLPHYPFPDRNNQFCLFQQRNKHNRRHEATLL